MSFESVIASFRALVRGLYPSSALEGPEVPFPFQLESISPAVGHHLVPLIMMARSDHELLSDERDVIVEHCRALLRHQDRLLSASEIKALEDFIEHFLPNATQLDTALRKFEAEKIEEFPYLIGAAAAVITADDVVRDEERAQLAEIKKQFEALRTKS
jgi:hypothetical protein